MGLKIQLIYHAYQLCQDAYQLSNGAFHLSIFTFHLKKTTHKLIYRSLKFFQSVFGLSISAPPFMKLFSKKSFYAIRLRFLGTWFRTHQMTLSHPMSRIYANNTNDTNFRRYSTPSYFAKWLYKHLEYNRMKYLLRSN